MHWVEALSGEGVAVVPLRTTWDLFEDDSLRRAACW